MPGPLPPVAPTSPAPIMTGILPAGLSMLFTVRLISRQPADLTPDAWQAVVADQLRAMKTHYEAGRVRAIYRETGEGVLAIFDLPDARDLDQALAQMPMARYFAQTTVHPAWDMVPTLQSL